MSSGLRKDIVGLGLVLVPVLLLLIGFHKYTALGKGLSVDGYAIVLTTSFAAALGFGAVMLQLRDQHRATDEELARQRKAVARALLFEIDGFYGTYLRSPRDRLASIDVAKGDFPEMMSIGPNPFPVYHGNASRIGELSAEDAGAVVHFFEVADSLVSYFRDYASNRERVEQIRSTSNFSATVQGGAEYRRALGLAQTQLRRVKDALPEAIKYTYLVCHGLCEFTGVPFKWPRIAVAAEKISIDEIAALLPDIEREGARGPEA